MSGLACSEEWSPQGMQHVVAQLALCSVQVGHPEQACLSACGASMLALNQASWSVQMGYREYARYLSFHFPFTHERSLLEHLRACPWKFDQRKFKAWRQGRTGGPEACPLSARLTAHCLCLGRAVSISCHHKTRCCTLVHGAWLTALETLLSRLLWTGFFLRLARKGWHCQTLLPSPSLQQQGSGAHWMPAGLEHASLAELALAAVHLSIVMPISLTLLH